MSTRHFDRAAELTRQGTPFVQVTLISTRGHAPQDPGAKILVTGNGLDTGTVGGGKVEAKCVERAKELLKNPRPAPELVTWNLQKDVGMTCGGEVTYLFETFAGESWQIVVFGAGHVAQALARTLDTLACRAVFVDDRPEWLERLPQSGRIRAEYRESPASFVSELEGREFVVVMTRGHATDMPVLRALYAQKPGIPYLGSIGSDVKALKIRAELKASGISPEDVARLHCPIGLPLGNNDPAEIAISIVAELIQERDRVFKT